MLVEKKKEKPDIAVRCVCASHVYDFLSCLELIYGALYWYSPCALWCLSLLKLLDKVDLKKSTNFIAMCNAIDGGYGCTSGGEPHAGQSNRMDPVYGLSSILVFKHQMFRTL